MSKPPLSQIELARQRVKWLVGLQALLISFIAILLWIFFTPLAAYSAVLGGLICVLPTAYFAARAFRYSGARAAKQIVRAFYLGEASKLFISLLLFALVFKFVTISAPAFFATFILAQMVIWLAPLVFKV